MLLEMQGFFFFNGHETRIESAKCNFCALGMDLQLCSRRWGLQELSPLSGAPVLLAVQ